MNLQSGSRLGPYEIVSPLGAGGMGEVFKARDTRLERSVAIKVLPDALTRDQQFRLRFEREARTISQLNHPHICTLYDVGRENGTEYLVMELIEGESLADRLGRGALPIDLVVKYGAQVADALGKAHQQGIVHRDLKPSNIMITKAGAKLLDFGLAKSEDSAATTMGHSALTEHKPITEQGTVIGTFQYMAPEQLEGVSADARTDIFALGAVLYEMATGRRAFEGKSRTSLIAAIVSAEPAPISKLQPVTPPGFEHLVKTCLAKDPDERWQSAHDIAAQLRWIGEAGSQPGGEASATVVRRRWRERLVWIAAIVAAMAFGAAAVQRLRPQPASPNYRFELLGAGADHRYGVGPRLSSDGTAVLFGAQTNDGQNQLVLRRLDAEKSQLVEGSVPLGSGWDFSRDGKSIAFLSSGRLHTASIHGGTPRVVANVSGRGLAYGDGFILVGNMNGGVTKVTIADGKTEVITRPDGKHAVGHAFPRLLPDGEHFFFSTFGPHRNGPDHHDIYVASVAGGEPKLLGDFPSAVEYGGGFLFYVREGVAIARRFDPEKLALIGDPVTVAQDVRVHAVIGNVALSASNDGTLAMQALLRPQRLVVTTSRGERIKIVRSGERFDDRMHIAPDGDHVLAAVSNPKTGTADIHLLGITRPTETRLTFDVTTDFHPVMSADGSRMYYANDRNGVPDIYVRAVDGTEPDRVVVSAAGDQYPLDLSLTAPILLYSTTGSREDLYMLRLDGGKPYPFVATPGRERDARFSPDGSMVAYQSDVSGRAQIYLKPVEGKAPAVQISTDGGTCPRWSRDGSAIYFLGEDEQSVYAASRRGSTFDDPAVVFRNDWEISSFELLIGGRFLVMEHDPQTGSAPIRVWVRWPETLEP